MIASRPSLIRLEAAGLAVLLTLVVPGAATGAPAPATETAPAEDPGPSTEGATLDLWLSGPFGRLIGAPAPESPETAGQAELPPLDTWVTGAPLTLDTGRPGPPLRSWTVTATDVAGAGMEILAEGAPGPAAAGSVRLSGPERPGSYLLVAHASTVDGRHGSRAWLLDVPDRDPPPDGLLDIPAPDVLVSSDAGSAAGMPGHGCYLYLCVEIGMDPPLETVPRLDVVAGSALPLGLSDGSPVLAWEASYTSEDGSRSLGPIVGGAPAGVAADAGTVTTLEAPPPGDWLLKLQVVFDRERGFIDAYYRLRSR